MSEMVLVSTHDLRRAGALRTAFRGQGFRVELVTPQEGLPEDPEIVLLVISEGADTLAAAPLVGQAAGLGLPVLGYGARPGGGVAAPEGLQEVFGAGTPAEDVAVVGRRLVERKRLQRLTGIVGETDAMREVLERVVQIAPVQATVLLTGESGTGKELVARGLHALSPRRHKAFIPVNVAALTDTLLESELFGHEKGAFTGAIDSRRGLFELAHGGTIFLDEIGEMPLATQTKLLRVLEQREFLRVGGEKPIRVDVRIVAATNEDLRQLVAIGDFRKDLYYRLNVLNIVLPPLRDRPEDIPLLVGAFIREATERHDRPFIGISEQAMGILQAHHWPGNVRELRNLVESMVVLAPGRKIDASDIPPEVRGVDRTRALVPLHLPRPERTQEGSPLRPQLEFVFRTLVELRVDMDELRRDFEAYRRSLTAGRAVEARIGRGLPHWSDGGFHAPEEPLDATDSAEVVDVPPASEGPATLGEPPGRGEEGVVVYRVGMTMENLEREAIAAALREVGGNRRKAAERLEIGERTLYRKIKKYGLDS